jgi:nucleotide-binding universal stress UspA family protein
MKALEEKIQTGISLKNILFATDFSPASEAALPYVAGLSRLYGSTVHVAHALAESNFVRPSAIDPTLIGSIYEDAYSRAQGKIQELALRLKAVLHKTYVRHGEVTEVLKEIIGDEEVDLVIAGTRGRTGVGKMLMGSVAEQILRQVVACPVLTVGPNVVPRAHSEREDVPSKKLRLERVLFATDFSPHSLAAAGFAFSLAKKLHSHLTLLHVIEDYGPNLHDHPGPIEIAFEKMTEIAAEQEQPHFRPESRVEFGSAADVILHTAVESHSGLIVLGAHPVEGQGGGKMHLPGATVHKVIAHAACPVLTVQRETAVETVIGAH